MANTLTNLTGTLYEALDTVSRELVGYIPAVRRDSRVERAALNQTVRSPVAPAMSSANITAAASGPATADHAFTNVPITISKAKSVTFTWNGEEQKGLNNNDMPMVDPLLRDQFTQAFRTLSNEVESDIAGLYTKASRSVGTAGTQPFGSASDLSDFANSLKELNINGSPTSDLHMVLSNLSAASLRGKQSVLFKVNESGTDNMLRNGALGRVQSFMVGESNQIPAHTKGTGTSYTSTAAGFAVGTTSIPLITGSGTVLAGDTVTFAGDTNKYVVKTGITAPGTIVLAEPGLKKAIPTSATAMTIGASSNGQNMAFDRNAIVLATRLPALPDGGDDADDSMTIVDPFTGLAFEISVYRQFRQVTYFVGLAWGYEMVKPEHSIILLS
jgi:hypothetical protein